MATEETYTNSTGTIRYYRAPALFEPLGTPRKLWMPILALAAVAAIIGGLFASNIIDNVVHADERQQALLQAALGASQDANIPMLKNYCKNDPEQARAFISGERGDVIYDIEDVELDSSEYIDYVDFIALPKSLSQETSLAGAENGVSSLPPADGVVFLKESWRMTFSRSNNIDVRIRYQDFSAMSVEDAINRAINYQQWQDSVYAESGEDNMGNTYQTGNIEIEDTQFRWSVYACPLEDVFDVDGLPENTFYVSVRMTSV